MRLAPKLLWTLAILMAALALTFYAITAHIVLRGFHDIEHDRARLHVARIAGAIEIQKAQLLASVADWANWDATYSFVLDRNAGFRRENLVPEAFRNLRMDAIALLDTTGAVVWAGALSDDGSQIVDPPAGLLRAVEPEVSLGAAGETNGAVAGFVSVDGRPMFVASHPIQTSEAQGPARGVLVMARFFDDATVKELGGNLHMDIAALPAAAGVEDPEAARALAALSAGAPAATFDRGTDRAAAYGLVRDLQGQPLLLLRTVMHRDIYQQGLRTCRLLATLFAGAIAVFTVILVVFQRRFVVRRLQDLGEQVGRVSLDGNRAAHVTVAGSDELSTLADDINRMLDRAHEAQGAMQESRQQYELLFRGMLSGFALHEIICDAAGRPVDYRFLAVNPAFERLTGLKAEHIVGRTVREVLPDTETKWIETYGRVALTGEPAFLEDYASALGKHFEVTAFRTHPGRFATIFADVTARKVADQRIRDLLEESNRARRALLGILEDERRAEAALAESRADYRDLFENMPSGYAHGRVIFEAGQPTDLEFLRINSAFRAILGLPDVTGQQLRACVPPEVIDAHRLALYGRVASTGRPESMETYVPTIGKWVSMSVHSPRRGEVVAIIDDITERQRAEQALRLQGAALAAAANAIVITDRNGRIEWVNPAFTAATGYTAQEAIGHNPRELIKSGHQDQTFYKTLWDTILAGRVWRGEIVNRRRDGSLITEEMTVTPVHNAAGDIEHFVAIKQDVTAHKRMEEQMLRAQRLESVGRLASGLAHDLNNILSPVLLAPPILREVISDASVLGIIDSIETSARRGADIIRQLLAFGRGAEARRAPLMLRSIVKEMVTLIGETFPKNIESHAETPQDVLLVNGDATQLHQLLMNLCVNARDAMPQGGRLTIRLEKATVDAETAQGHPGVKPGPHAVLSVSDTGTGIPPEHLDHIFDPFFTTKPIGEGTGLGLSTAIGIVRSHQGFIDVQSRVGAGTTFRVYLPITGTGQSTAPASEAPVLPQGQGECVLVVDDEESIRRVTGHILQQNGYRVLLAAQGHEAMKLFHKHRADVRAVVTDLMMREMDGPALMAALRRDGCTAPILVVSGYLSQPELQRAVEADARAFLPKPCSAADLLTALREALSKQ